ncbi:MAG TPA: PA2169 family four-helix-bundle protein [Pseudomonas sp.]|nr:PA2169 family four-helix-bundle protein [Pseudomonas sp.]
MPTLDKTIEQLNQCLVTCYSARLIFQDFAKISHAEELRYLFTSIALTLPLLGEQLQQQIRSYGGRSSRHASVIGMLHCGWQWLKLRIGKMDDRDLLNEGLRVERAVCQRFETLLQGDLPPVFRDQLMVHYGVLLDQQAQLQALLQKWRNVERR